MALNFSSGTATKLIKTGLTLQSVSTDLVSMCAWVRPTNPGTEQAFCVAHAADGLVSTGYRGLGGTWQIHSQPAAAGASGITMVDEGWHFAAFVTGETAANNKCYYAAYGASTVTELSLGGALSSGTTVNTRVIVGNRAGDDLPFTGDIAHARVWRGALSKADFEAEMASATMVKATGGGITRVLAWELDSDATDGTGNGNTGTITGTESWVAGPTLSGGASAVAGISRHYARMMNG